MTIFLRLTKVMAPFRWWIALSILLGFLTIGTSVGLMAMSAYLISRAALVRSVADLSIAIAAVQLFAISRAALRYTERYVTHATTFRILARLRSWIYACLEPLAPARLSGRRSGDVLTRLTADVDTLEHFYARTLVPPLVAALVTTLSCVVLGAFNVWLGIVLLGFLLLAGVALPLCLQWLGRAPAAELTAIRAEFNATLVDETQGISDLMAFSQRSRYSERTLALSRKLNRIQEHMAVLRGSGAALGTLLASLAGLSVLFLAIPLVTGGSIDGVFLAVLPLTVIASFEAVQTLGPAFQNLEASGSAARRLFEIIDQEPAEAGVAAPLPNGKRRLPLSSGDYSLDVKHLCFAYAADEAPVLVDLSFCVPNHGCRVIVGPSGAGKSTLVSILLKFWDYQAGSITVGGCELRDYHADDVRTLMSVVAQETYLFSGTLRDNLLLANPDARDDQLEAACEQAKLHHFIASLPRGYDTWIGENGVLLSGGERQRLAIARAILKDAPILLLDEATVHLDSVTEEAIWRALTPFMAGRTTLILAHRQPRYLPNCQVLTLDQGRAVACG